MKNYYYNNLANKFNSFSWEKGRIVEGLDQLVEVLEYIAPIEDQWINISRMYISAGFGFNGYYYYWTKSGLKISRIDGRRMVRGEFIKGLEVLKMGIIEGLTLKYINCYNTYLDGAPLCYLMNLTYMAETYNIDLTINLLKCSNFRYLPDLSLIGFYHIESLINEIQSDEYHDRQYLEIGEMANY